MMTSQVRLYLGNCYKYSYLYLGASKVSVPGHCIKNTGLNKALDDCLQMIETRKILNKSV